MEQMVFVSSRERHATGATGAFLVKTVNLEVFRSSMASANLPLECTETWHMNNCATTTVNPETIPRSYGKMTRDAGEA